MESTKKKNTEKKLVSTTSGYMRKTEILNKHLAVSPP